MSAVGRALERVEDEALLTGRGSFVGAISRPGQVWARFVRAPVAHARIVSIDADAAAAREDVLLVATAEDLPDVRIPIRLAFAETPECAGALQPPLARDRVRYVGEPVAVVVATDPYLAEDAAESVVVEYEELPAVVDAGEGQSPSAPVLHDALGSNLVNRIPLASGGDVDELFAQAAVVVRERLHVHRHTAVPLETRGVLAEPEDGRLVVRGAAKVKHFNRSALATMLGLPESSIRLVEGSVGGAFGVRGEFYPEDLVVPWLALRLGRPVKWIEDRYEHLVATNHSREQDQELEVAAAADGTLLAFRARLLSDLGAYVRTQGILLPLVAADHLPGPYAWRGFEIELAAALTNKTPSGTYRSPGVTEATFARERLLDLVAAELELDPAELRRRNLIRRESLPFVFDRGEHVPPLVYDSGDFLESFERLLAETGYDELRRELPPGRGLGLACFVELGGIGPFERARIVPERDGRFTVHVGVAAVGQGLRTVLGQIAADALGVPPERVSISHEDTDVVPEGFGTFASRSTILAGNAIALAAADLQEKLAAGEATPVGEATFEKDAPTFSFGANLSLVEVDRRVGRVRPLRHVIAFDCGRAVNPALVRGQLVGGAAQGIAGALYEELAYDDDGQPLSTSLVDYLLPTLAELPEIDALVLEYPTDSNPLGIKGAGEAGVPGAFAAVANAVADALGPAGRRLTRLPLSMRTVLDLLEAESASDG